MACNATMQPDRQITALAGDLARRILGGVTGTFAIVETAGADTSLRWPAIDGRSSAAADLAGSDSGSIGVDPRGFLRQSLQSRLPQDGTWCILDGLGSRDAVLTLHPQRGSVGGPTAADFASSESDGNTLAVRLTELLERQDPKELFQFLTQLRGTSRWFGIYAVRCDTSLVSPVLRYCEAVFAAVDVRLAAAEPQPQVLRDWLRQGIPVHAAWLVAA